LKNDVVFCVGSTVGALNIVLAGETTEGSGVPSDILDKLPTMTYIAAKSSQENRKANIKDGDAGATNISMISQISANGEGDTIEVRIPGLQVGDCDEQESELGDQAERTCEICQSEYEPSENVMVLPCNHFYHELCIGKLCALIVDGMCTDANPRLPHAFWPRPRPSLAPRSEILSRARRTASGDRRAVADQAHHLPDVPLRNLPLGQGAPGMCAAARAHQRSTGGGSGRGQEARKET
jgi:hypothetical protein